MKLRWILPPSSLKWLTSFVLSKPSPWLIVFTGGDRALFAIIVVRILEEEDLD